MNIFGIGGAEFIVILIIMLIIAGPKRMATWAVIMGKYVGKLRVMWSEVVDVVQKEIDEAGVDVKLPKDLPTRQNISKMITDVAKPISQPLEEMGKQLEKDVQEDVKALKSVSKEMDPKRISKSSQSVMGKAADQDTADQDTADQDAAEKAAAENDIELKSDVVAKNSYQERAKAAYAAAGLGAWGNNGKSDNGADKKEEPAEGLGTWGQSAASDDASDSSADSQAKQS
ncbi:MAG: hypothetical protein CL607_19875 [Anaerolineaceae bacterium]|nr:hypothetical protein [Anaerolineaceae bacterium]